MKTSIKKLNSELGELCRTYHERVPLSYIFTLLKVWDLIPIDEDGEFWEGFICGSSGKTNISLMESFTHKILKKHLQLSWYQMSSGNYEVNAYIL